MRLVEHIDVTGGGDVNLSNCGYRNFSLLEAPNESRLTPLRLIVAEWQTFEHRAEFGYLPFHIRFPWGRCTATVFHWAKSLTVDGPDCGPYHRGTVGTARDSVDESAP